MISLQILVLEDEPDLRNLYAKALQKAGYEVHPAATLQMARDLLTLYRFDVFLCDIQIGSDKNGVSLLRQEIDKLNASGTKVIILSSEAQYRPACEELGIEFFIEKPVAIHSLITLVNRLTTHRDTM